MTWNQQKSIHFYKSVLHDLHLLDIIILRYFQLMSDEVSLKISWKYFQIVSSKDHSKHCTVLEMNGHMSFKEIHRVMRYNLAEQSGIT